MEWLALAIPIVGIVSIRYAFPHRMTWWEFTIPLAAAVITIAIGKYAGEVVQTSDTEFWTGPALDAEYYEAWNERVPCTHPKYKTVRDRDGNTKQVQDGYMHAYDVDDHPPYWHIHDNSGNTVYISSSKFEELASRWKSRKFVDLHRSYHTRDGDKYVATWDGSDRTMEVVTTIHRYENRPQSASSVYSFSEVSDEAFENYGLVEYPEVRGHSGQSILGSGSAEAHNADRSLNIVNARLGKPHQIRVFIILFHGKDLQASFEQENLWKGGNKNELNICIGLDTKDTVSWCRVFSWTDKEECIIRMRNHVLQQKGERLDLSEVISGITPIVEQHWKRKEFADFNYLDVDPPLWCVILTFVMTALTTGGSIYWCVHNEYRDIPPGERPVPKWRHRKRAF